MPSWTRTSLYHPKLKVPEEKKKNVFPEKNEEEGIQKEYAGTEKKKKKNGGTSPLYAVCVFVSIKKY